MSDIKQTALFKAPEGRVGLKCFICPGQAKRRSLKTFEKVPAQFDDSEVAREYGRRHRASESHLEAVRKASNTAPTSEERMLDRVFNTKTRQRCKCGLYHKRQLSCELADLIQEEEDTA